jgi:sec-independent protein translocase protein TatC
MKAQHRSNEMPFLDHLEELRWRLLWSLAALFVGLIIGFVIVMHVDVISLLMRPLAPHLEGRRLVFTHPGDPFSIHLKAAFAIGFVLALPVLLYQVWAFVSPALYRHERRLVVPVLVGAVALFVAGVSLAYFVILPVALHFLLSFGAGALEPMITASAYFGFAITMSLALGVVFEMPIVILALTALGLVTPPMLRRFRRHAIVVCVVLAAFITPPEIASLALMSVPLVLLYELSIALSAVIYRRRQRSASAQEAAA